MWDLHVRIGVARPPQQATRILFTRKKTYVVIFIHNKESRSQCVNIWYSNVKKQIPRNFLHEFHISVIKNNHLCKCPVHM